MSHIFQNEELQATLELFTNVVENLSVELYDSDDSDVEHAFIRYIDSAINELQSKRRYPPF